MSYLRRSTRSVWMKTFLGAASLLAAALIVGGSFWGNEDPADNERFELGDGVAPTLPGRADILGDFLQAGPDWEDLFNADRTMKDQYDEFGQPGANGVPDFLDTWGVFRTRRDAAFVFDDVSAGGAPDGSALVAPGRVGSGSVDTIHDLGNAYAYFTYDSNLNPVLYVGAERLEPAGPSYLRLEFNQDAFSVAPDGEIRGSRRAGDLEIRASYDASLMTSVEIRSWELDPADHTHKFLLRETLGGGGESAEQCNAAGSVCALCNAVSIEGGEWPSYDDQGARIVNLIPGAFLEVGVNLGVLTGEERRYRSIQLSTPQDYALGSFERAAFSSLIAPDQTSITNGCMQDTAGFHLECTANDVNLAQATLTILDGCDAPGDTATIDLGINVNLTAQERHDIGIYLALAGGDALTGTCNISILPFEPNNEQCTGAGTPDACCTGAGTGTCEFVDLDGVELGRCTGDLSVSCVKNQDCNAVGGPCIGFQDECGDIDAARNPIVQDVGSITVTCVDDDGDGFLDLPTCTSWRQPGDNDLCLVPSDAVPGAPSKCKCESIRIDVPVPKALTVVKDLIPSDDPATFNLQIDGVTGAACVGDGGSTGPVDVSAGFCAVDGNACTAHSDCEAGATTVAGGDICDPTDRVVGETACAGTALVNYSTSISCFDDVSGTVVASCSGCTSLTVPITPAQTDIVCTITNELIAEPSIQIIKTGSLNLGGDGIATPGDLIHYTYDVTNTGNVPLTAVTVTDDVVASADIDCGGGSNVIGTMAPGAMATCTGTYAITQADIDAGVKDNIGTVIGTPPGGLPDVTDDDPHSEPIPASPAIEIVKEGSLDLGGDGIATPGDLISYTFQVTNTGNVTLSNVDVTDPLVSPISCPSGNPIPSLAPGASETCTGSYAITQADIDAGNVHNLATATGDCPDGSVDCASDDDDNDEPIPQTPAIHIEKTPDLQQVALGGTATFLIQVTNTGNVTLTNVTVSDPNAPNCDATIGTLAPGAVSSYSCTLTIVDDMVNVATATGTPPQGPDVTDDDDAAVDALPVIQVTKTANVPMVPSGGSVTYTVVVTNNSGASDPVTLLTLVDDLTGDLDMDTVSPHTWTWSTCDVPQLILPGASYTCTFAAVLTGDTGQTVTDVVTGAGTDDEGNPAAASDDETVTVVRPSQVTSSALCVFDQNPNLPGEQFNLILPPDVKQWPAYKLSSSNPGQFFYNVFHTGTPGDPVTLTLTLPYPFVTQGANPIHVYESVSFYTNEDGFLCFQPGTATDAQSQQVVLGDYVPGAYGSEHTVVVNTTIPDTGCLYLNIHLDYGLKGPNVDADGNGMADRYDKCMQTVGSQTLNHAIATGTSCADALAGDTFAIPDVEDHMFSFDPGPGGVADSDTVQNVNLFKKNPGVAGLLLTAEALGGQAIAGIPVDLIDPTGTVVGTNTTDDDGFYQILFKHKGKPATFTVRVRNEFSTTVTTELKANAFQEVSFLCSDGGCVQGELVLTPSDGGGTGSGDTGGGSAGGGSIIEK